MIVSLKHMQIMALVDTQQRPYRISIQ